MGEIRALRAEPSVAFQKHRKTTGKPADRATQIDILKEVFAPMPFEGDL
jgi:hypothetical protein